MIAFNLTDTWFVAQLGELELAAMSFTFPVVMVLISLGIGLMAGTSSVLARAIGAGEMDRVKRLTTDALLVALALAGLCTVLGLATMEPLFTALGAGPEVRPLIREYMTVWYGGYAVVLVPMVGFGALRAVGDSKLQGTIFVAASVINVALDPLLIFGVGSMDGLGLQGAAVATVAARTVTLVAAYRALRHKHRLLAWSLPSWRQLRTSAASVFHVGLPAAGTNMVVPAATAAVVAIIAEYGPLAVAGFGASTRIESMSLVPFYALSAVIGPFVGQNLGAGQVGRIAEAIRITALFCLAYGALSALTLAAAAGSTMSLFSDEAPVQRIGSTYLWTVPVSNGAYGIVMVVTAAFNGLGRPLPGVAISVIRMGALYLPLAYAGAKLAGLPGAFVGICVANLLSGAIGFAWFVLAVSDRRRRLSEEQPAP